MKIEGARKDKNKRKQGKIIAKTNYSVYANKAENSFLVFLDFHHLPVMALPTFPKDTMQGKMSFYPWVPVVSSLDYGYQIRLHSQP